MKIATLNTYLSVGGAAKAATRLNDGLHRAGVDLAIVSRCKGGHSHGTEDPRLDWRTWLRGCLDILPCKVYPKRQLHNFAPAWVADGLERKLQAMSPDLVHLHWVGDAFLRIETLHSIRTPLVWTLHDSWPFSGGCYLPGDCRRFESECGGCPVLGSGREHDLSRWVLLRKRNAYPVHRITAVAPSHWMADRARASSVMGGCAVEVIPNGVDTSVYSPGCKMTARDWFGLSRDRHLILFGARHALSDCNKGFDLLCSVIGQLPSDVRNKSILVLFGESNQAPLPDLGLQVLNLGPLTEEEEIVMLYRAADLLVLTSRQENLPNIISEALACGLPSAAFDVGGVADQIHHHHNGCLAPAYDTEALATEIVWLLESVGSQSIVAKNARRYAVAYLSLERMVQQYLELYWRLINRSEITEKDLK